MNVSISIFFVFHEKEVFWLRFLGQVVKGIQSSREQQGQRTAIEDCKKEDGYKPDPIKQHGSFKHICKIIILLGILIILVVKFYH